MSEDLGTTPPSVRKARRRRRIAASAARVSLLATAIALVVGVGTVIVHPWADPREEGVQRRPVNGSLSYEGEGTGEGAGGTAYIGDGGSGQATEAGSGGTAYGPGSIPTFLCRDGSLSFAQHSRGACSHHGGIAGPVTAALPTATMTTPPISSPEGAGVDFCVESKEVCLDQSDLRLVERARAVADVLTRYYAALNVADYATAYALLNSQRRRQITERAWAASLTGTTYAHIHVVDFRNAGSAAVVSLSYVTRWKGQSGKAADICRAWTLARAVVNDGGSLRIGTVTGAATVPCSSDQEALSKRPLMAS
jgi:hypothetical protein